jgi:serine/threonine protein phosphatase PrpC
VTRPKLTLEWQSHALTHPGKVRPYNEDAFLSLPGTGIWAVADGMGGHEAGDVASAQVVEALAAVGHHTTLSDLIASCRTQLTQANAALFDAGLRQRAKIIGSTAVVLLSRGTQGAVVWAGDSRAYQLRGSKFRQISEDHSRVMELVKQGVLDASEAEKHPDANIITRAIGVAEKLELDVVLFDVQPGDQFLLCSDGLSRYLPNPMLAELLDNDDCVIATDALLKAALDTAARDNITAVVIRAKLADATSETQFNPQQPGRSLEPDDDPTMLDDDSTVLDEGN